MKLQTLLTLATLTTACDPCHSWDEVKIVDRKGLDQGEAVSSIRAAIDTFAAWTGREQTCVGRVKVVEELEHRGQRIGGVYNSATGDIRVLHRENEWAMGYMAIHELCHAVDNEEGTPSEGMAQALEPYTEGLSETLYATDDERTHEAFANICEVGPRLHPLWRQIEEHCGDDYLDDAYQAVHELMFTAGDREIELGSFEGSVDEWELAGLDPDESTDRGHGYGLLVTGADGVFMLDTLYNFDDQGELESYQPVLRRIDPHSATVLENLFLEPFEEHLIDATGNFTTQPHALLGSNSQPLLYDRFDPGSAWRVHSDPLELEVVSLPALVEGARLEGFDADGQLIASIDEGDGLYQATAALGDTAWAPLAFEGEELEGADVQAFDASEEGALLVFYGATGPELASLSIQGELEWTAPMGLEGGSSHTFRVNRLPDGSVLAAPYVPVSGNTNKKFPLRYDPVTDSFSAPTGDCHTMRYYLDSVSWEGGYWMVYRPDVDGVYGPLTLLQLHIQPQ